MLAEHIRPDNPLVAALGVPLQTASAAQLAAINAFVTRQATMIAYLDDFKLTMLLAIAVIPLLLLLRRPDKSADTTVVPMD